MSLLDDLRSIDLSAVVDAKATLSVTVSADDVQALVDGEAAEAALAQLGTAVRALQDAVDDPEALLEPLGEALLALAGEIDVAGLPLDDYVAAVREGAALLAELVDGFDGDPARFGRALGLSLGDALEHAGAALGEQPFATLREVGAWSDLLTRAERGVPRDPGAFARFAAEALLPFDVDAVFDLRRGVDALLEAAASVELPAQPAAALVAALDAVAVAAAGDDTAALAAALREVERLHAEVLAALEGHLAAAAAAVDGLRLEPILALLDGASRAMQVRDLGLVEFMGRWRSYVADLRAMVEAQDFDVLLPVLEQGLDVFEAEARARLVDPVEAQVQRVEAWLRGLLRHLGLRRLRGEVTSFLLGIAARIREADVGRFARDLRALLDELEAALSGPDLAADVQAALAEVQATIDAVLGPVEAQLVQIVDVVENTLLTAAEEIDRILGAVLDALRAFQEALTAAEQTIANLGIEAAGDEVVRRLVELRETAEELLGVAPLPDALRPVVEQLIAEVEGLDLDAVLLDPVLEVARQIEIPESVGGQIQEALGAVDDVLHNLIPAQLVADLQAELDGVLATFSAFDPGALLGDVTGFLDDAAATVRALDPTPLPDAARAPYEALLAALDAVRPRLLLQPVVDAYDAALGAVSPPDFEGVVTQATRLVEEATGRMGEAVMAPLETVLPGSTAAARAGAAATGGDSTAPAGGSTSGGSTPGASPPSGDGAAPAAPTEEPPPAVPELERFRPGDLVRHVFGLVPAQLRGVLADVQDDAAPLLSALDGVCGGLARDLRALAGAVRGVEAQVDAWLTDGLAPLSQAAFRARLAVRGHVAVDGVDLEFSGAVLARVGPGALRQSLGAAVERTRGAARGFGAVLDGGLAARLEQTAGLLDGCALARAGADLDAVLDALDPEPLAAEMDALLEAVLARVPDAVDAAGDALALLVARLKRLLEEVNPGRQALRFLRVVDVLKEELDLLDPRRLVEELDEIHAALRASLTAYDPAVFAQEIADVVHALADALEALDPAELLGDLALFDGLVTRLEALDPAGALEGIGADVEAVGAELAALDPAGLIAAVNDLPERVVAAFEVILKGIQQEVVALLESIRYAAGSASVTVEASVST